MTTIRPMGLEDLAAAVALEQRSQLRPWSERVFRDELAGSDRIYLMAESEGPAGGERHLAGFTGVMMLGDEAHVTNLLVAPEHRRRGLGRRLMVAVIEAAIAAGGRHLTLEVRRLNEPARAMYSSLGLAPVGVRPRYYGDDDALILWAHDIDDPGYLEGLR